MAAILEVPRHLNKLIVLFPNSSCSLIQDFQDFQDLMRLNEIKHLYYDSMRIIR